ncbi:MAG: hypothetical protein NZM25_05045 [Leptospiraceae bacterium]|nr:hypothetical protein [Leptospiraceae bacterium]MDW8305625.1 hypothetical protein [Leptospiraceae bacterium]
MERSGREKNYTLLLSSFFAAIAMKFRESVTWMAMRQQFYFDPVVFLEQLFWQWR